MVISVTRIFRPIFESPSMRTCSLPCALLVACWLLNPLVEFATCQETPRPDSRTVSATSTDPEYRFTANNVVTKITEERRIPCSTPGIILESKLSEGVMLSRDDLMISLDDRKAQLEVDRLKKELDKAEKEASTRVELEYQVKSIDVAIVELNRAIQSNQRTPGAVAQTEIDQLNLMVQKARSEKDKIEFQIKLKEMAVDVRKVELAIGKEKLADHKIRSPIAGMVVEVFRRPGEWVEMSEPVCRMIRLDKLRAEVKVPAEIALNNLVGSEAVFQPSLPSLKDMQFSGKVIFVDPEANPVSREMRVWVEIDNRKLKLVPGLAGKVSIK